MAHDSRVARRYANALFETAQKYNVIKSVEDDLAGITSLLDGDRSFHDFLLSPYVGREEKLRICEKLFSDRITALTMQFVRLALSKRRESELKAVYSEFVELRRLSEGVLFVSFASATELDKKQREALEAKIALTTKRKVEAEFLVNPSLIGGVKATFENTVLDGTVRGSLKRIQESLTHDVLKQI
ncbi:MAG: ATP synthase F1 subunit delta [Armatimonadetes bacterium]|nr:ATP synthase F1 subunit delta [Armatimonadota bacterium]